MSSTDPTLAPEPAKRESTTKTETAEPKVAPTVEPAKLVEQVAKATRIRGAKVESRQGGKRHVITVEVDGKRAILAYVDPLRRGTGFRVEVADYGAYRRMTVEDVAAAAAAVKTSERRAPKAKKAAPAKPAAKKAAAR
jgi:hypothetical protein